MNGQVVTSRSRVLASELLGLAGLLVLVAVLGPFVSGTLRYRYSETMLNQAVGLDAFAMCVVAPVAMLAAALCLRGRRAGPLLAMGPAGFALYMSVQYVVGPEYLTIEGNGERGFLLFVVLFVVAGLGLFQAWSIATPPAIPLRASRRRGWLLMALAAFVVLGMYVANGFVSAMADFPSYVGERAATSEYDEHPTAFWLVAFLDLAVVVPLTAATGFALLRHRAWADRAFFGVVGWFALVPGSVAAMAVTMVLRDDPAASTGRAVALTVVAVVLLGLVVRTCLRPSTAQGPRRSRTPSGREADEPMDSLQPL